MLADAQANAVIVRDRLTADVRDLEQWNPRPRWLIRESRSLPGGSGRPASLGKEDEDAWHSWYYEKIGYRYMPPPKVVAAVNALPSLRRPGSSVASRPGRPSARSKDPERSNRSGPATRSSAGMYHRRT